MSIKPGDMIALEIASRPTNEAAEKTIIRLCRKDPAVVRRQRAIYRKRPSAERWRRGGKMWHHQMKSQSALRIEPGAKYQIRATLDVLRDLPSIQRFVKVTSA